MRAARPEPRGHEPVVLPKMEREMGDIPARLVDDSPARLLGDAARLIRDAARLMRATAKRRMGDTAARLVGSTPSRLKREFSALGEDDLGKRDLWLFAPLVMVAVALPVAIVAIVGASVYSATHGGDRFASRFENVYTR